MANIANFILGFSASLVLIAFAIKHLKAMFIVGSMSISREVEHGEGAGININFYSWESKEQMFAKYQKYVGVAEMRKQFCADRFNAALAEAQQQNKLELMKNGK